MVERGFNPLLSLYFFFLFTWRNHIHCAFLNNLLCSSRREVTESLISSHIFVHIYKKNMQSLFYTPLYINVIHEYVMIIYKQVFPPSYKKFTYYVITDSDICIILICKLTCYFVINSIRQHLSDVQPGCPVIRQVHTLYVVMSYAELLVIISHTAEDPKPLYSHWLSP